MIGRIPSLGGGSFSGGSMIGSGPLPEWMKYAAAGSVLALVLFWFALWLTWGGGFRHLPDLKLPKLITMKKMRDDLDYWIHIGIGDDIIFAPKARAEYQHLVAPLRERRIPVEDVPALVLEALDREMKLPFWKRPTFWKILGIQIKRILRINVGG